MTNTERMYAYTKDLLFVTGKNTRGNLTAAGIAHNAAVTSLRTTTEREEAIPAGIVALAAALVELDDTWLTDPAFMDPSTDMNLDLFDSVRTHHNLAVENMQRIWP